MPCSAPDLEDVLGFMPVLGCCTKPWSYTATKKTARTVFWSDKRMQDAETAVVIICSNHSGRPIVTCMKELCYGINNGRFLAWCLDGVPLASRLYVNGTTTYSMVYVAEVV